MLLLVASPLLAASPGKEVKLPVRDPSIPPADTVLLDAMQTEMQRAMSSLGSVAAATAKVPAFMPYFVSYSVADNQNVTITAQFGALTNSNATHNRVADVQVRLGTPGLDNTHGDHRTSALTTMPLPLGDNRAAIERTLWFATNRGYGKALDALEKVKTEQQVRAKEEDTSADFSAQKPIDDVLASATPLELDRAAWADRLRAISAVFRNHENILYDMVILQVAHETDYFVSSEGTKIAAPAQVARLIVLARTRATDGMDLFRAETFESDADGKLPDQASILTKTEAMAKNLDDLRTAPITEPYNGPAILSGRAAAVLP